VIIPETERGEEGYEKTSTNIFCTLTEKLNNNVVLSGAKLW
jgi:hypothetical protein